MSEDFGLLNIVVSPLLERVARDEQLAGDQPRKPNMKSKKAKKDPNSTPSEDIQQTDEMASSQHIDLRI